MTQNYTDAWAGGTVALQAENNKTASPGARLVPNVATPLE